MSKTDAEHEKLERLMRQASISEPSDALKRHVTEAAQSVWTANPDDVPVQVLLVRLATSAAAAVLLIASAECFSSHVAPEEHPAIVRSTAEPANLVPLLESYDLMIARHLTTNIRTGVQVDARAVRTHLERTRKTLDESQRNGISGSTEGRSGPIPRERDLASYS
jgi:hypothetical protein